MYDQEQYTPANSGILFSLQQATGASITAVKVGNDLVGIEVDGKPFVKWDTRPKSQRWHGKTGMKLNPRNVFVTAPVNTWVRGRHSVDNPTDARNYPLVIHLGGGVYFADYQDGNPAKPVDSALFDGYRDIKKEEVDNG